MEGRKGSMLGGMLSATGLGPVLRILPWIPAILIGAATGVSTFVALSVWNGLTQGDEPVLYQDLMVLTLLAITAGLVAGAVVKVLGRGGPR